MAILEDIGKVYSALFHTEVDVNSLILQILFAIFLLIVGILLGKIIKYGLKKASDRLEIHKKVKESFIDLFLTVVKWSIYIIFLNIALFQLPFVALTGTVSTVLVVIPAFVTSLVLIAFGFGLAIYLRNIIEESEMTGWKILSQYFFYFILYVFGIYALKISLVSLDELTTNIILITMTIIAGVTVAYCLVKKSSHRDREER